MDKKKNLIIEYKVTKKDSLFKGDVLLVINKEGISCSINNHEYDNLKEATRALNETLNMLLRMATEDFVHSFRNRIPTKNEVEVLAVFVEAIEKAETLSTAEGIVEMLIHR